jgi:hypothetical protein
VLRDKLWLSPDPGPAFPVNPGDPILPPLQFDIHFFETPNQGNGDICADGTSRTLDPINSNGCADLFGVQSASAFVQQFVYDGQTYQITIAAVGLGPQNATFCAAIGLQPGCVGFRTAENQSNDLNPSSGSSRLTFPSRASSLSWVLASQASGSLAASA